MDFINILLYAIPGLAVLVVVHELGHLLFARWTGIGVEAFSIFFGRAIYSFKWKGIDWRIGWIPFGGYCKMKGQEDFIKAEKLSGDPDEFYSRPTWARLLTVLGGPVFNIILGLILVTGIFYVSGEPIFFNGPIELKEGYEGRFGLKNGDIILAVDGKPLTQTVYGKEVSTLNNLRRFIVLDGMGNDEYNLTVKRDGQIINVIYPFHEDLVKGGELGFTISDTGDNSLGGKDVRYSLFDDKTTVSIGAFAGKDLPAMKAGLKQGDIILSIDNQEVRQLGDVLAIMNKTEEGGAHSFLIQRGQEKITIDGITPKLLVYSSDVQEDGEVYKRGLRNNDIIESINGQTILSTASFKESIKNADQKENFKLGIIRGGKPMELYANGMVLSSLTWKTKQVIGVHLINGVHQFYSIFDSIPRGVAKTWTFIKLTVLQFGVLSKMEFDTVKDNVAGPVGIFKRLGESAQSGFGAYINFLAILSILLGIFNLLPIPAVDGGHVVLTLYEMIKRKPLSIKTVQRFQFIGVFIIISLAVLITINDIIKIVLE